MRRSVLTPILILLIIAGLGVLFYPDVSSWYNSRVHAEIVFAYQEDMAQLHHDYLQQHWQRAHEFNKALVNGTRMSRDEYMSILNFQGVMALVEIPAINVMLPVRHTADPEVLLRSVGHMEQSSLPVGGESTHAVLTAHSAWASHRLFTDLEELVIGDLFFIRVLGETLAYQVDQLRVVWPHEIDEIRIIQGADHVTLITCTPYRINSHRLLVRGIRIPYIPGMEEVIASVLPEETIVTSMLTDIRIKIIAATLSLFMFALIIRLIVGSRRKRKGTD